MIKARVLLGAAAALWLCLGVFPVRAEAQQHPPARFFVTTVGDSTFTFSVPSDPWVKAGIEGITVDPARHDSLVARFRVLRVEWGQATAIITGQTTQVTTSHVALLQLPSTPWYKRKSFWVGLLLGGGAGAAAVAMSP